MKTYNEFFSGYRMGKRLGKLATGAGRAIGSAAKGIGSVAAPIVASAGKEIGKQVAANIGPALAQQLTGAIAKKIPGASVAPGGPSTGITTGAPSPVAAPTKLVPRGTASSATVAPTATDTSAPAAAAVAPAPAISPVTPGKTTSSKTITSPTRRKASVGVSVPAGAAIAASPATVSTANQSTPQISQSDLTSLINQKTQELNTFQNMGAPQEDINAMKADLQQLKTLRLGTAAKRKAAASAVGPKLQNASVDNKDKKVIKEFWPAVVAGAARLAPAARAAAAAAGTGAASTAGSIAAQKAINKMEKPKTPGEECEGSNTDISQGEGVINIKGTTEELKKVLQILKSNGLLENKYNMKDMADKKQVNEVSVSGALVGGGLGSLVGAPGLGAVIGAGLPGAVGAMKRGLKGEEEESKKKKKKLDPVGKEDADVDNDGKKNTASDQYILKKRAAIANARAKVKAKESTDIRNFIKCISQKNYAEANKYLQEVVNSKIKERIAQSLKNK